MVENYYEEQARKVEEQNKKFFKRVRICTLIFVALILFFSSLHVIPTGYTGVVVTMGKVSEQTLSAGTVTFKVPFVTSIKKINNKQQSITIEDQIWGETKDKTPVYAQNVTVTYQILPDKSAYLYSTVSDMSLIFTGSIISSAVKDGVATLEPADATVRSNIEPLVRKNLNNLLKEKYGEDAIYVNQVTIGDMNFEDAYNEAIQKKSIAQQTKAAQDIENETAIKKAEADKQVVITNAEAKAETKKIEAEAEAEANEKLAKSISDVLVEYQKIQKWDGKLPTVTGGSSIVDIGSVVEE